MKKKEIDRQATLTNTLTVRAIVNQLLTGRKVILKPDGPEVTKLTAVLEELESRLLRKLRTSTVLDGTGRKGPQSLRPQSIRANQMRQRRREQTNRLIEKYFEIHPQDE